MIDPIECSYIPAPQLETYSCSLPVKIQCSADAMYSGIPYVPQKRVSANCMSYYMCTHGAHMEPYISP